MTNTPENNSEDARSSRAPHRRPLISGRNAGNRYDIEDIVSLQRHFAQSQRLLTQYAGRVFGLYALHQRVATVLDVRNEPMIDVQCDPEVAGRETVCIVHPPVSYDPDPVDGSQRRVIELSETKHYEHGQLKALVPDLGVYADEEDLDGDPLELFSCYDLVEFSGGGGTFDNFEPSISEILFTMPRECQSAKLRERDAQLAQHIEWLGRAATELNVPHHYEPFALDPFVAIHEAGLN